MTLDEARQVVEAISSRLSDEARIIWGAQISDDMANTIRALIIVTGVSSPQIFGTEKRVKNENKTDMENELGIEFVE